MDRAGDGIGPCCQKDNGCTVPRRERDPIRSRELARRACVKGTRIGDPSPHEWSGGICRCKPQRGGAIHDISLVDYGALLHMAALSSPGMYEATFNSHDV